jgi:hypothetical protein
MQHLGHELGAPPEAGAALRRDAGLGAQPGEFVNRLVNVLVNIGVYLRKE